MKRIEIIITTPEQALEDFAQAWKQAERGEMATPTIGFGSPSELFSVITDRRLELLRHVAQHESMNIHQLAKALGRDYKNVHTDVKALKEIGLLERDKGKLVAPFDEIEIRLDLRKAA